MLARIPYDCLKHFNALTQVGVAAFLAATLGVLFVASTLPLHAQPDLPRVTILGQVSVKDSRVLITDLLTSETRQTLAAHDRIQNVSITLAPLPGKAKTLEGRIVRDRLADFGITSDRFSIQIPQGIRLERQGQTLLPTEIEKLAREQFLPKLPWDDVQLQEISILDPIVLPYGKVELDFQRPARTDLARPFYLNIDFRVDGQLVKRAYVRTVLTVFDTVAVAARDLSASEKVTAADIELERRPLKSTLQRPVRNASFFEGRRPRAAIAVGEPLFEEMFVTVPLIRRGDTVTVVFDDGRIRVSTQGQSLASGSRGDRIRVINATSHAELIAEVVNETTVRIVNSSMERIAK
jgi:flagella basal body P-ring formation protein FlgA